ncbi:hypothetical protein ACROYT_G015328 [Oculina patagonica]
MSGSHQSQWYQKNKDLIKIQKKEKYRAGKGRVNELPLMGSHHCPNMPELGRGISATWTGWCL